MAEDIQLRHSYIKDSKGEKMETVRKTKKMIGLLIFLLIVFFLFDRITWLFRGNEIEGREDIVGIKKEKNLDVILVGGSDLKSFFRPLRAWKDYGFTSYNYGTSGARFDLYKYFIEDAQKGHRNTKLYVINIRTIPYVIDEVAEQSTRNWSDSLPVFSLTRIKALYSYLFSRSEEGVDRLSYFLDIINYHNNWTAAFSSTQFKFLKVNGFRNVDKGITITREHVPLKKPDKFNYEGTLTKRQKDAIDEMLNFCKKEKLTVLFTCAPVVFSQDEHLAVNAAIKYIRNKGFDCLDLNDHYSDIGLDFGIDYGDVSHVNYLGSIKYTNYLCDYLSSHYNLPDHRKDDLYKVWWKDYYDYEEQETEILAEINGKIADHLVAYETGLDLHNEYEWENWWRKTENSNYTVVIVSRANNNEEIFPESLKYYADKHNILLGKSSVAIYDGGNYVDSTDGARILEMPIGIDGGRGTDDLVVDLKGESPRIAIAGDNYYKEEGELQVLVYDRNYKEILDNIVISIQEDKIIITR